MNSLHQTMRKPLRQFATALDMAVSACRRRAVDPLVWKFDTPLTDFCRGRMAADKYPRTVKIVEKEPRNTAGKFLRKDLRGRMDGRAGGSGGG